MSKQISAFQRAIEAVESLTLQDQVALLELLQKRLAKQRRKELVQDVLAVREEYAQGQMQFGSVDDFLAEIDD
ncbi:MAG: hypothetical protein WBA57_10990 [Elainellaceae cyanobacterium]